MPKPDSTQLETPYLLGRAWVEVWHIKGRSQNRYLNRANKAYQQAHNNFHRCDTLWMSAGLLFYFVGQLRDCFDSFVSSIRLNPNIPLAWRNLGLVVSRTIYPGDDVVKLKLLSKYDRCGQYSDAFDGYEKAFQLGLHDPQCWERITALHQHRTQRSTLPPLTLEMEDFDISKTTCETNELQEDSPIEIAALHLEDDPASHDWNTSSDEDSDFESDLESDR